MRKGFAVFLSIFIAASCARNEIRDTVAEAESVLADYLSYAAHHIETYHFDPESPLISRVTNVPEAVLVFLRDLDGRDYQPYYPTSEQWAVIEAEIEKLPPLLREVLRERVVGFYFIDNLWGSGLADFVVSEDGEFYSYVVFNPGALTNSLDFWLTYKENTCFIQDETYSIRMTFGESETAIAYILAHELTHSVDYTRFVTPYTEPATEIFAQLKGFTISNRSGFAENVWEDYFTPLPKYRKAYQCDLDFYGFGGGPYLHASNAVEVYTELEQTPFASLYGNLVWAEDLTEFVALYHLTQELGYHYEIEVYSNDVKIYGYRPMENPLVTNRFSDIRIFYEE